MSTAFKLSPKEHLGNPEKKAIYTQEIFTQVAPKYKYILGFMSFFQDRNWKKYLLSRLGELEKGPIIDLATGHGEIAFELAKKYPEHKIEGIDITPEMIALANKDNIYKNVVFKEMNLGDMYYPDNSISCFTGGYALRNSPDLQKLISQMFEYLMPGGKAGFVDFSKSPHRLYQWILSKLLWVWCGGWSFLLHGNVKIYGYIPESLILHPDRKVLYAMFEKVGFERIEQKLFLFGIAEVLIFKKPKN